MNYTTTAIYENGTLHLGSPIDLPEQTEVEVTIQIGESSLHSKVRKALQINDVSSKSGNIISDKRRRQLTKIFSGEQPLSDYINDDRDNR